MAEDYWVAEWVQSSAANRVAAWWLPMCCGYEIIILIIPVVPHKAVAEVSKIGSL